MAPWVRLCFVVLAVSSSGVGAHNGTAEDLRANLTTSPPPSSFNATHNETWSPSPSGPSTQSPSPEGHSVTPEAETQTGGGVEKDTATAAHIPEGATDGGDAAMTTVTVANEGTSATAGYVVLALIVLVIIALCVILYLLRKASKTYSFDLQRPPAAHREAPPGTFELVDLDEVGGASAPPRLFARGSTPRTDGTTVRDSAAAAAAAAATATLSPPLANGTTSPPSGRGPENATQQQPNGTEAPPTCETGPTPGSPSSAERLFDPPGTADLQPDLCLLEEIDLDEQLFTSPPPSSVLPFSPFSFSPSSSPP